MHLNHAPVDPAVCPLCGSANGCAAEAARAAGAAGAAQPPCWCMTMPIPPQVLARIPAEAQGLACVCQRCAAQRPASD